VSAPDTPKGGRPKGLPKTGGRRRGTPNRATVSLREKLDARGYDPILKLVEIAEDTRTPLELRVHIHLGIAPYLHPKRKPVDQASEAPMTANIITTLEDAGEVSNERADTLPKT